MLLTTEAAREDTNLWLQHLGKCVRNAYYDFCWYDKIMLGYLDYIPPEELLKRFLAAANLYPLPHLNAKDNYEPLIDVIKPLYMAVESMYAYSSGNNITNNSFIDEILLYYIQITEKLSPLYSIGMRKGDEALEAFISPRFAYAYKMYRIRNHFTNLVSFPDSNKGVSPPEVATVAGVAYTYIIKLIKTKKLYARKANDSKNWIIPINSALEWLMNRSNCPSWICDISKMKPVKIEFIDESKPIEDIN